MLRHVLDTIKNHEKIGAIINGTLIIGSMVGAILMFREIKFNTEEKMTEKKLLSVPYNLIRDQMIGIINFQEYNFNRPTTRELAQPWKSQKLWASRSPQCRFDPRMIGKNKSFGK